MKLIEKLADQYYQDRPEGFGDPREDFMAGFRKAREMAIEAAEAGKLLSRWDNETKTYLPDTMAAGQIADNLLGLGESEVQS